MIQESDQAATNDHPEQIRKIVVLGGGTAGFLTGLALRRKLPADVQIVLVRSKKLGVIGVGEGTIPSVVNFLQAVLGIDAFQMYSQVKASPKLGIRYLWGKRPWFNYTFTGQLVTPYPKVSLPRGYFCEDNFDYADINSSLMNYDRVCMRLPTGQPRFNRNVSYHLENKRFVAFLEQLAIENGLETIDDLVSEVTQDERGIKSLVLESGQEITGDLFVDCSGFRGELIKKTLNEEKVDFSKALFCDKAIVGGWKRTDETYHPYTTAETMDSGWCWRIEHDDLINRGYVFCSSFISDEDAEREYRAKNPKVEMAKVIQFGSYIHRRTWVKNVVAIGNAAGFVEPLEATSIGMICDGALRLMKALQASNCRNLPIQREIYNRITLQNWEIIRDFLALHYKFNNRLDTPFWKAAMNDVELGDAQQYVDYYRQVGPDFSILTTELKRDFFTAEGYLVMLLGQQVPFNRPTEISDQDRMNWKELKDKLHLLGSSGCTVPEFLEIARRPNAKQLFGMGDTKMMKNDRQVPRVGESVQSGELKWH